jgi:phosphoglycerol transferase
VSAPGETIGRIVVREAWVFVPVAVLTFIAGSVLTSGWPAGLIPDLATPFAYSGDGLAASWLVQNLIHGGSVFHSNRSGYPFGSDFFDYPMSDAGSFAILKVLGWITPGYRGAINLYFLLSFPVTCVAAYAVLRQFRISPALSAAGAVLFTLLPFHFLRLQQLFLTWYFVVPVFFLIAWRLYGMSRKPFTALVGNRRSLLCIPACFIWASFGVYYAVFGMITVLIGGVGGWLRNRGAAPAMATAAIVLALALGVVMNVAPSLAYMREHGVNREVAHASPEESEIFGLKLIQMALPRVDHRIARLGDVTRQYDRLAPLVNENSTATLGLVGTSGLVFLAVIAFMRMAGRTVDERLAFLALVALACYVIGTIGGVSALFATLVSATIRGWNRISVFIAFAAVAAAMIGLQSALSRLPEGKRRAMLGVAVAVGVGVFGVLDETAPACRDCNRATRERFERDRNFIGSIEKMLPAGAGIYQLPYMAFPEVRPQNRLQTYDLAVGALLSNTLRWSYAGMKGREGDLFFRTLAEQPLAKQVEVLRRLRFSGIYIDRRGYADDGRAVENELRSSLGTGPELVRADHEVSFFRIEPGLTALPDGLPMSDIIQLAGLATHNDGALSAGTRSRGIDFRREALPAVVREVRGLSAVEPWGRWSDANISRSVTIEYRDALPGAFTLVLRARAFGPNAGKALQIKVGRHAKSIVLADTLQEQRVTFDLDGDTARVIEITPPLPVSPAELLTGDDRRKLGIGIERIWLEK